MHVRCEPGWLGRFLSCAKIVRLRQCRPSWSLISGPHFCPYNSVFSNVGAPHKAVEPFCYCVVFFEAVEVTVICSQMSSAAGASRVLFVRVSSILVTTRSGIMTMEHRRKATMNCGSCMRHIKVCVCDRGLRRWWSSLRDFHGLTTKSWIYLKPYSSVGWALARCAGLTFETWSWAVGRLCSIPCLVVVCEVFNRTRSQLQRRMVFRSGC